MNGPLRIVHLHVEQKIGAITADGDGRHGAFVVCWWRDVPLGHFVVEAADLSLSEAEVRERALHAVAATLRMYLGELGGEASYPFDSFYSGILGELDRIVSDATPVPEETSTISIVICTRDRADQLGICLDSLGRLVEKPHEVIVVDNAPQSDQTKRIAASRPDVRYVLEPRPGLDHARNAGVNAATGDIVAFADDDVEVHPQWTRRLRRGFADPGVKAVTGLVLPAELETPSQVQFEKYWSFHRGYIPRLYDAAFFERHRRWGVPAWEVGAGANMAFRRQVFEKVGLFDERLDAGAAGCSGDSEMWYRVLAEGHMCRYEPTAVVYHYHRREDEALKKQLRAYMRGHTAALLIQYERYGHRGNLWRLMSALPRYYARRFARALRSNFAGQDQTLFAEMVGGVEGVSFYLRNRRPHVRAMR